MYVRNNNRTRPSSCNERALEQYGPRKRRAYYIHRRLASFKRRRIEGLVRQSIGNGCGGRVQFPTTTALFVVDFFGAGGQTKKSIERRELFALFVGIVCIVVDVYCPSPVVCCCICASCLFDDANHGTSELPSLRPVDNNNKEERDSWHSFKFSR